MYSPPGGVDGPPRPFGPRQPWPHRARNAATGRGHHAGYTLASVLTLRPGVWWAL